MAKFWQFSSVQLWDLPVLPWAYVVSLNQGDPFPCPFICQHDTTGRAATRIPQNRAGTNESRDDIEMTGTYKRRQWGGGGTSCRESKMCECTRAVKIELPDFRWTPADLGWLKISWCSRDVGWACLRGLQELMLHCFIWYLQLPVGLDSCNSQWERADQEASQTRSHTRLQLPTWQQIERKLWPKEEEEEDEEENSPPPGSGILKMLNYGTNMVYHMQNISQQGQQGSGVGTSSEIITTDGRCVVSWSGWII